MAVIINEFDVILAEPEEASPDNVMTQPTSVSGPKLTPQDIYDIVQRRIDRMTRIWAH